MGKHEPITLAVSSHTVQLRTLWASLSPRPRELVPRPRSGARAVLLAPCPPPGDPRLCPHSRVSAPRGPAPEPTLLCQRPRCWLQGAHGRLSSSRSGGAHSPRGKSGTEPAGGRPGVVRGGQGCRKSMRSLFQPPGLWSEQRLLPQPTPAAGKGRGHLAVASSRETEAQAEAGVLQGQTGLGRSWPCLL